MLRAIGFLRETYIDHHVDCIGDIQIEVSCSLGAKQSGPVCAIDFGPEIRAYKTLRQATSKIQSATAMSIIG